MQKITSYFILMSANAVSERIPAGRWKPPSTLFIPPLSEEKPSAAAERLCRCKESLRVAASSRRMRTRRAPCPRRPETPNAISPSHKSKSQVLKFFKAGGLKENYSRRSVDHESHHFVICIAGFNLLGYLPSRRRLIASRSIRFQ